MINYEDILIEMARTEREARERVIARIAAQQLGEAWDGLTERRAEERDTADRRVA